jgi:hypothetical protein
VSFFSEFALAFGLGLVLIGVVAAWLFRTTNAPLAVRLAVPALIVGDCCATPYAVNAMLGLPVTASIASLPDRAALIAFVPNDEDHRVDLWLRAGDKPPRAYEVGLDDKLKKTLRDAEQRQARGQRVVLSRHTPGAADRPGDMRRSANDDESYVIDESAMTDLPPKE